MGTICDSCKHMWKRLGKNYCNKPIYLEKGNSCKYSKTKKQCPCYEKGENIKKYISKSNSWNRKENK